MRRINLSILIGILLTALYLTINFITINDYGVTWDFSYHFNAGLWHLGKPLTDPIFILSPSAPLPDTIPVILYNLFYEKLKILPFDAVYNLYSVILGSVGVGILFFAAKSLFNFPIAFFSSVSLALLPRYFGHLHNNMKDIPQAAFFTLSLWMFWRLYKKPKLTNLVAACLAFAVSYNSKINAVFILLITFAFLIFTYISRYKSIVIPKNIIPNLFRNPIGILKQVQDDVKTSVQYDIKTKIIYFYFILAPLFAFLLWSIFWENPIGRLLEAFHTYTTSTTNMPLLYFGKIVYSGQNVPWHYPLGLLAVTTPILIIIFFLIGLYSLVRWRKLKLEARIFLFLWLTIPLSRYLKPHMIIIDDIRHFMEAVYPLSAIAGIGMYRFYLTMTIILHSIIPRINKLFISFLYLLFVICYLLFQNISYHPYQTSYYNELIGGIKGAQGKFDVEFWAHPYKQALFYLNSNAPLNSKVTIPMAPDVAALYLRNDLKTQVNKENLASVDPKIYEKSDYIVVLKRQSFFDWYGITPYIKNHLPIYSLSLDGVPLVSIYKN